jgi:hypothetical protein
MEDGIGTVCHFQCARKMTEISCSFEIHPESELLTVNSPESRQKDSVTIPDVADAWKSKLIK